jgi:DNA-binding transcriptional ArsR family regulator
MVKEQRETIEHKTHNKILSAVAFKEFDEEKEDYAANIAKVIGLKRSDITQQLSKLEENNYVILNPKRYHKNLKMYSINWLKLSQDFFKFIESQTKRYSYITRVTITKNKYFIELIKSAFYLNFQLYKKNVKTIKEIFNELFMQMIFYTPLHTDIELIKMSKNNPKIKDLISFTEEVYNFVLENECDSIGEYYRRITQEKILEDKTTLISKKNK